MEQYVTKTVAGFCTISPAITLCPVAAVKATVAVKNEEFAMLVSE